MKKIAFRTNRGAGFGHQFMEWLFSWIYCQREGYIFYHIPFAHQAEGLDNFVNIASGELLASEHGGDVITENEMTFTEYINSDNNSLFIFDWNTRPYKADLLGVSNQDILDVRPVLRRKFFEANPPIDMTGVIAVHIRRDNVSLTVNSERFMPIEYFIDILTKIKHDYPNHRIMVFSSNVDQNFHAIKECGVEYNLDTPVSDVLLYLINAPILVASRSGISFVASLISEETNIKICPKDFWHLWPEESVLI